MTLQHSDVHLTLCLTRDCNLRCSYCYGGRKAGQHLALDVGERALDLALERTGDRLHLIFFGGEPLLRWSTLVALVEMARVKAKAAEVELRLSATTNGTLLDDRRAVWLRDAGFQIALSCDGTEEAHDRNRLDSRQRGSWTQVVAGLSAALEAELRTRVVLVIDPSTVDVLPDSVEQLVSLGVREFVANVNWEAHWGDEAVQERWSAAYEELARRWVDGYRRGEPWWISVIDDKIATHLRGGYQPHELCDMGRRDLVVAPSGRLYPCDRLVGEDDEASPFVMGDVFTGPDLSRVSEVAAALCNVPGDCLECELRRRCRNRCGCANLALTGRIDRPSEILCIHEQLSIRCADAAAEVLVEEGNPHFLKKHYGEV